MLSALAHDCRTAVRRLWRAPWYAALLTFTLAFGIGSHAAVFSLVATVLYPDHAFDDAPGVVTIEVSKRGASAPLLQKHAASMASQTQWFSSVETVRVSQAQWRKGDSSRRLIAGYVTPTLLSRMSAAAFLGRDFRPDEGTRTDEPVVIISESLWRRDLAAAPTVLGTTLVLGDERRTIVGVAKATPMYPRMDVWIPAPLDPAGTQPVSTAYAWLRPGLSADRATAADFRGPQLSSDGPDGKLDVRLLRPNDRAGSPIGRILMLLWSGSGFVLVIMCANLVTLLAARNMARQRELSTCAALGASRTRIVRPLLLECLLLGLAGGALAPLVTAWSGQALLALTPRSLSFIYPDTIPIDARVLAYTTLIATAMGAGIGLLSAARWARTDILRAAGRDESYVAVRYGARRLFAGAVAVQTALAAMLVIGAALMLTSFVRLRSLDPGFEPGKVAELRLQLDAARYPDAGLRRTFVQEILTRTSRLHGVTEATTASDAPPHSAIMSAEIEVPGRPIGSLPRVEASWVHVAGNYFRVLRIPIVEGRTFTATDGTGPVIVSRSIARRYWAAGQAVGQRFRLHRAAGPTGWLTIIGVAGDVSGRGFRDQYDEVYLPFTVDRADGAAILARTEGNPASILQPMRAQLWSIDPDVADAEIGTLSARMARSIDEQPFYSALFTFFALAATLLAMLGVFGVAAHAVAQRRREIAVHLALGARRSNIQAMVIRQGAIPSLLGAVIGLAGAISMSGVMRSLIQEVSATDARLYLSIAIGFGVLSLLATWWPARRASRLDPATLLRT